MFVRADRRLPGIAFEARPPPLDEALPRMDVAVFVGFAASGPRAPCRWRSRRRRSSRRSSAATRRWRGTPSAARRCARSWRRRCARSSATAARAAGSCGWRVTPSYNVFPLAGLVRLIQDPASPLQPQRLAPAFARSRAAGRWSDTTRVATTILAAPLDIERFSSQGARAALDVVVTTEDGLIPGDILRISSARNTSRSSRIERRTRIDVSPPSARVHLQVEGLATWFTTDVPAIDPAATGQAVVHTARREPRGPDESFALAAIATTNTIAQWETSAGSGLFELGCRWRSRMHRWPAPSSPQRSAGTRCG